MCTNLEVSWWFCRDCISGLVAGHRRSLELVWERVDLFDKFYICNYTINVCERLVERVRSGN